MNTLGYLVTILNLQNFLHNGADPINNIAIKVEKVSRIANDLTREGTFQINDFAETGYYRRENTGKYVSKAVQDYLFHNNVSSTDEGVELTLFFRQEDEEEPGRMLDSAMPPSKETLTYYFKKQNEEKISDDVIEKILDRLVNRGN